MSQTTSITLIEKLKNNRPDGWNRFNGLYGPLVGCWFRSAKVQESDIPDLVQKVFCVVLDKVNDFHKVKPEDTFRGWLRVIARNITKAHFREFERHHPAEGGSDANVLLQNLPAPEDESDDPPEEKAALLHRAFEFIKGEFSNLQIGVFHKWSEGKTFDEIAAEVGTTAVNARQIKARVMKRIREELGDD